MTIWLLFIAAFCSCSSSPEGVMDQGGTIMITGTVSNTDSNSPIEGVKIVFNAFSEEDGGATVNTHNVYTDSNGIFNITAEDINTTVICLITAEHDEYVSEKKEIIVNWKGISYDAQNRTFFVNDCDFHLAKK